MLTTQQQIIEQVDKAKRILITFSRDWKGDAVASALALRAWLTARGRNTDIAAEAPSAPTPYTFLPGFALIGKELDNLRRFIISLDITNASVDQVEYRIEDKTLDFIVSPKEGFFTADDISSRSGGFRYDLIFVLGAPDLESLGTIYDDDTAFFFETTIINIDRNAANENFGQINLVDVNAVAVAEIVHGIITAAKTEPIDADIATCLLTGLIAETKSFKTPSVTPHALMIASDLITKDARREEIINALYRSRQLNVLKLWGCALTRLKSAAGDALVWTTVSNQDFTDTQTDPSNLYDVIDELIISMPEAQVIVLFFEYETGTRAIVHSTKNLNVLELTHQFKGEGSRGLAVVTVSKPLVEAVPLITTALEEKMARFIA